MASMGRGHKGRWITLVTGTGLVLVTGVGILMNCADPRENENVTVVTSCDADSGVFEKLSTDPSSPQSSVVAYVNAAEALQAKVAAMDDLLRDGCNDVNAELGLPAGSDVTTACQAIAQRGASVHSSQPAGPPGPPPPPWFGITFPPTCQVDANARAKCVASCSASACDNTQCSPATKVAGTCTGTCLGTCTVTAGADASTQCLGDCQGTCTYFGPDGGPIANSCLGECNGVCTPPSYVGFCAAGCGVAANSAQLFVGECDGTCTGTCGTGTSAVVINGGIPDGGLGPDASIPNNAPNNCVGSLCTGWCSNNAYGNCPFPCAGPTFKGGICSPGACIHTCTAGNGSGCAGTCDGVCTYPTGDAGASCPGTCNGTCMGGTVDNPACNGSLSCGQNVECNNACEAMAGSTVTCTAPNSIEVEMVSDLKLYQAYKDKGGKIAQAIQMLATLRSAEAFIDNRTLTDFAAVGATGEVVRACVARGQAAVQQAASGIASAVAADPTRAN